MGSNLSKFRLEVQEEIRLVNLYFEVCVGVRFWFFSFRFLDTQWDWCTYLHLPQKLSKNYPNVGRLGRLL